MGAAFGGALALGISFLGDRYAREPVIHAQMEEAAEEPNVTEDELELYIEVYRAMQADRSLKIAEALERREMSLAEFRAIERRVQMQERLIQRVRESLLEQAVENAASLSESGATGRP